jgi:hypothetical protein
MSSRALPKPRFCLSDLATEDALDFFAQFGGRRGPQRARFVDEAVARAFIRKRQGKFVASADTRAWSAAEKTGRGRALTYGGITSVAKFSIVLGKQCVRSHQGEMAIAPLGIGRLASRRTWRRARTRPPPALSPARTIWEGWMGRCLEFGGGPIRKRSGWSLIETKMTGRGRSASITRGRTTSGRC